MIKKGWLIFIAIMLLIMIYVIIIKKPLPSKPKNYVVSIDNIPQREKKVLNFVTQKISGSELSIYTNYVNHKSHNKVTATGEDILSESQGLLLLYLLNRDKKEYFDLCFDWTRRNLLLENGTFSWVKTKFSQNKSTNALIDDLRLVRALILANEKWDDKRYLKYINKTAQALLAYNFNETMPLDFYDNTSNYKSNEITISYLDLFTMKQLSCVDIKWDKLYRKSYKLVKNAKIRNTGLYQYRYNLNQHIYTTDDHISLIQSIYVMIHLAEINEHDINGMNWLWREYEKYGKIFSSYSYTNHEPITDIESTALYALMARLFYLNEEYDKAETMLKECEKFQVMNTHSEIYGSFGNDQRKEVYSFDNLQYLLSSSIIYKNK